MKAVTLDGEDVTDTPLDFSGKGSVSGLRIVMTDRLTTVSGRVVDSRGRPLTDYAVVDSARGGQDRRGRGALPASGCGRIRTAASG